MTSPQEYQQILSTDSPERGLLYRIPWMLDAARQSPDALEKALRIEAQQFAEWSEKPIFTIVTPLFNTPPALLEELIASVRLQSWPNWELILRDDASTQRDHIGVAQRACAQDSRIRLIEGKQGLGIGAGRESILDEAKGTHAIILDHDDLIHPQTLSVLAKHLGLKPDANFIYTNEAKIDEHSKRVFSFLSKPAFDKFLLLRINYICHLSCTSMNLIRELQARDGTAFRIGTDGAEDHDFFLRLSTLPSFKPHHIPLFTYYWRTITGSTASNPEAKSGLAEIRQEIIKPQADALYGAGGYTLTPPSKTDQNSYVSVKPVLNNQRHHKVQVIVPFRDNSELTIKCLESIKSQDCLNQIVVTLVNNNSTADEKDAIHRWLDTNKEVNAKILDYRGAFNFAKINNFAFHSREPDTTHVLFLNNDVEIRVSNTISTLMAHLDAHPECAFAGVRLMYPNHGGVQHGGIRCVGGFHGSGYTNIGHATTQAEFVYDERVCMGVTFACAMTRTETFERLAGLEEKIVPNGFGDVDICLRARELGMVNHYYGTLEGIHHESKTRKHTAEEIEFAYLHSTHGKLISEIRLRELCFDWQNSISRYHFYNGSSNVPVRYKIADIANNFLKKILGPLHSKIKIMVLKSKRTFGILRRFF